MSNPPRIWLDYRPLRIGWVISNQDLAQLTTTAMWNACLWGGRHNCVIPVHDAPLADALVACFEVDILLPVRADEATRAFIARFPHLRHHRWWDGMFHKQACEFVDMRHAFGRIILALQDGDVKKHMTVVSWEDSDALDPALALMIGRYPAADENIPVCKRHLRSPLK